jgi:stearoyl-CoA desaturase (Delta-9 desaturase)
VVLYLLVGRVRIVLHVLLALALGTLVGLLLSQVATAMTSVYLHRSLSHRAMRMRPGLNFTFRVLLWLLTGIRPREWVAVHRKHHAYTDVEGDPHSPVLLGWVKVEFANVALYRKVARDPEQVARYARDLPADRWDRVLFDRAWLGLGLGITFLIVVLGPIAGITAAVVHATTYLLLSAAVNSIGHTFGRRPYENTATNLQWLAWITGGEGLHNNHHEAPTSARFAHRRGEIDPSWWAIRTFAALRLAKIRHRTPAGRTRELAGAGSPS